MNLENLKQLFQNKGCSKIYVKQLSPNDNSKNQVYFGGSFDILNILPVNEIRAEEAGEWKKERFKAALNFAWVRDGGSVYPAPKTQLILYPKYPEVRLSGFLKMCENPPSDLMTVRMEGRLLFFSVSKEGLVLAYVAHPESEIVADFEHAKKHSDHGVFKVIELQKADDNKATLIQELKRVHQLGWIKSKRLDKYGNVLPCESSNCGGYTLEAELGITPNGFSEPDYLGWEVKQFNVSNFRRIYASTITLMTPEPTDGVYKEVGVEFFLRRYGYRDRLGREDRLNFGGVHKVGKRHKLTTLELHLLGFDKETGKIRRTNGRISLVDLNGNEAASWSFASMLKHWNRKHNQACYVPSMVQRPHNREYMYGDKAILGVGTDFQLFLKEMAIGNIVYDPGIKMENAPTSPTIKRRSQFRIKSLNLPNLYGHNEIVELK